MKTTTKSVYWTLLILLIFSACKSPLSDETPKAEDILGNSAYKAISFGGYREKSRDQVPTVKDLKEDLMIMSAMGIKILRTYNTQQFPQASNLLKAIREIKEEDPSFEMYVMLGAWIDCKGAWTPLPDHTTEDTINNQAEIDAAVAMAREYPDIVRIIAVGNEAMVHWATSYFVNPGVILKWVNYLQDLKTRGELPRGVWITSSDNFASWGGGDVSYHNQELEELIRAVDYISMHTYPFHDSHYNPDYWVVPVEEEGLDTLAKIDAAMIRARDYAVSQYESVKAYVQGLGLEKAIHIGETGWASMAHQLYGDDGSRAADEYKAGRYYHLMREWSEENGISVFYFEAFDEQWKDSTHPEGSENHFGLINLQGEAKYALWPMVEKGIFKGLTRNDMPIKMSYKGNLSDLMQDVLPPPEKGSLAKLKITTVNEQRITGEPVSEKTLIICSSAQEPGDMKNASYPSAPLKVNPWEGTCAVELTDDKTIHLKTRAGDWWGFALEMMADGKGENLTGFSDGKVHFEIKGDTKARFQLGFQTGLFGNGTQINHFIFFGPEDKYSISENWRSFTIPVNQFNRGGKMTDVTSLLYLRSDRGEDGKEILLRNIYFTK